MRAIPKMRVTWRSDRRGMRRAWEVWEDWGPGKKSVHYDFYCTKEDATSAARAQARQDKKDAANAS